MKKAHFPWIFLLNASCFGNNDSQESGDFEFFFAVASSFDNIFEHILCARMLPFITTCDNQLSFKSNVETEICVFLLEEIIRH